MYVEDLFLVVRNKLLGYCWDHLAFDGLLDTDWHRNFIDNVATHIITGHALSTNQSKTILKLFAKVRHCLVAYGMATDDDISRMLAQPEHRRPLYESVAIPREVRFIGDNRLGFRFKQNDIIKQRIERFGVPEQTVWLNAVRDKRSKLIATPHFDWPNRMWIVPVFRHNLSGILALIQEYRFGMDEDVAAYLRLALRSLDKPSTVVLNEDRDIIIANVCDHPLLAGWMTEVAEGVVV